MFDCTHKYLTSEQVRKHLQIGKDALRSLQRDSHAYGLVCPFEDIGKGSRMIYRWGNGHENPYRVIDRWWRYVAAARKKHNRRLPNGFTTYVATSVNKGPTQHGKRRKSLRELIKEKDAKETKDGEHKQNNKR